METSSADPDIAVGALRVSEAARQRRARHREADLAAAESSWDGVLAACAMTGETVTMLVGGRRHLATLDAVSDEWLAVRTDAGRGLVRRSAVEAIEITDPDALSLMSVSEHPSTTSLHLADALAGYVGTDIAVRLVSRSGSSVGGLVEACGTDVAHLRLRSGSRRCYVALDSVNELWSSSMP